MTHANEEIPLLDSSPVEDGTIPESVSGAVDQGEPPVPMRRDREIPRLVGVGQAAEMLGVVRQRVQQLINEGAIPANIDTGNYVMREEVVREFKARREIERARQEKD